jgi:hypothetical protein
MSFPTFSKKFEKYFPEEVPLWPFGDPLADHPELPLATEDEAENRWAPVDGATGEPLDLTPREFPWGELPKPPDTPAGKRWVNRGNFMGRYIKAEDRDIRFVDSSGNWSDTVSFSGDFTHIELVDA